MALQAGRLFGNYRVVRLIGEGAFGEVYLAENPLIDRRAAIKVLRPMLALDAELVRRFFNEARAASAIRHPNIIEVYDAGETPEGAPYILMEFLEGKSLKKRLAEVGKCSVAQTLEVARQAGSALAAAHAVEIVHRDLKPENLFLVPDASAPGGERVKILDFGIAKVKGPGGSASGSFRTEAGLIMGSPTYMSPEQCKDSADVDLRADVYSFATILYEMLAGRPPYVAATGVELLLMHLSELPRPLGELVADVPVHVEAAIMHALRPERRERFEAVSFFVEALQGRASAGLQEALPAEIAPASVPAAVPDRIVTGPAVSTFSLANAQLVSESEVPTRVVRRSLGRWVGLPFAGLVGLGLVIFLQFRHEHQASPPATHRAAATPPSVSAGVFAGVSAPPSVSAPSGVPAPDRQPAPQGPAPPALSRPADKEASKDANQEPTKVVPGGATSSVSKKMGQQHRVAARAQAAVLKRDAAKSKGDHRASLPPVLPDQEDVAGF
jgi:serine/threonine-protein kinase